MKRQYAVRLVKGAEAVQKKTADLEAVYSSNSTASGFTIIGMSGIGKTTAIERVLSLYPQKILHTQYNGESLFLTQLVWAKIRECLRIDRKSSRLEPMEDMRISQASP